MQDWKSCTRCFGAGQQECAFCPTSRQAHTALKPKEFPDNYKQWIMGGVVTESGPGLFTGGAIKTGPGVLVQAGQFVLNNLVGIGGLLKSIRDKAKAKKALAIAQAGGYDTLTPYQKSLITYQTFNARPAINKEALTTIEITPGMILILAAGAVVLFFILRPVLDRKGLG